MGTETQPDAVAWRTDTRAWIGAITAGIAGGVVMGVIVWVLMPAALTVAIPALYGLSGGFAGWTIHLFHSAVLGVVFAAILSFEPLRGYADDVMASTALGTAYGVVLWVVTGSLLLPLWLQAVGFPAAPPVPTFAVPSLLWHVAYGVVLGAVFPFVKGR